MKQLLFVLVALGLFAQTVTAQQASNVYQRDLLSGWEFREEGRDEWFPARIPGTVHTDLFRNDLIPEPYFGNNEPGLQWIENKNWEYRTTFEADTHLLAYQNIELHFDGLDTYAEITLNGGRILTVNNMFRRWDVAVREQLQPGKNVLSIRFLSPVQVGAKAAATLPYRLPMDNDKGETPVSMFVRKAGYHFGWDFAPRFVTSGIWRPVRLRAWNTARIADIYFATNKLTDEVAQLSANLEVEAAEAIKVRMLAISEGDTLSESYADLMPGMNEIRQPFNIAQPRRWWPHGHGNPELYKVEVAMLRADGSILDRQIHRMGLRTVELVRDPDSLGTSFYFKVNGKPIFVKGANYVPGDVFVPNAREKRNGLFAAMKSAHFNMIRVWGGGIYEDDDFYKRCDEAGILVWQDLMFAGGMYPHNPPFLDNVRQEIYDNVRRLRSHPSLALWCGNNEIEVAWYNWGWQEKYGIGKADSSKLIGAYRNLFENLIPEEIRRLDNNTPYIPTSPLSNWGAEKNFKHHNMHYWGVWHGDDKFEDFKKNVPRFMTEYGFQSFPGIRTLGAVAQPQDMQATEDDRVLTDMLNRRQKSYKGNAPILDAMKERYGKPKNLSGFLILSQLLQRDAMRTAIAAHRMNMPRCMGSLYWQLNDCWPGPSWSTVDHAGRWKAAHFALKRLYAPVLVKVDLDEAALRVHLTSDLPRSRIATMLLRLKGFEGEILWSQEQALEIPVDTVLQVLSIKRDLLPASFNNKRAVLEVVIHKGGKVIADDLHYFAAPAELDLPDPQFTTKAIKTEEGFLLEIRSEHLLKDIEIELEGMEVRFSNNYFDVAPGRKYEVTLVAPGITDEDELLERLRFKTLVDWLK